ncbi:MAG: response regulator [Geothrix sp.]|nr:response regulator [Holophagaceae bacterium]MCC6512548.1 response regulator [Geothrix sp.]
MIRQPILIVDDELEVRETLLEALSDQGYSVEAVASAEEALARMAGRVFPVVLTDLHMPGGQTGLDLIGAIRHQFPNTLCVLITAYATLDTSIEALKRGAYDLIQKPFRLAEMEVVLNRALDHASLLEKVRGYQEELESRILSRTRDLQEAHAEALALCDLVLQALDAPSFKAAVDPLLDRLAARWSPDGLGLYRRGKDGNLHGVAARGRLALPPRIERPQPGPLTAPGLGYVEDHLLPLGPAGWLYLGFDSRSAFMETDPAFLLLARHLELVLRVR